MKGPNQGISSRPFGGVVPAGKLKKVTNHECFQERTLCWWRHNHAALIQPAVQQQLPHLQDIHVREVGLPARCPLRCCFDLTSNRQASFDYTHSNRSQNEQVGHCGDKQGNCHAPQLLHHPAPITVAKSQLKLGHMFSGVLFSWTSHNFRGCSKLAWFYTFEECALSQSTIIATEGN